MNLFETVTPPSERMERQTTPSIAGLDVIPKIAFSSKGKIPNYNKTSNSIKPNKLHSKPVCFGGRKTRDERKICFKICLFGFPDMCVMGSATTAARKVVSYLIIKITISSLVIGLKMSYFPLIRLPSCYRTVCYWIVCYWTVCYWAVCYRTVQ